MKNYFYIYREGCVCVSIETSLPILCGYFQARLPLNQTPCCINVNYLPYYLYAFCHSSTHLLHACLLIFQSGFDQACSQSTIFSMDKITWKWMHLQKITLQN